MNEISLVTRAGLEELREYVEGRLTQHMSAWDVLVQDYERKIAALSAKQEQDRVALDNGVAALRDTLLALSNDVVSLTTELNSHTHAVPLPPADVTVTVGAQGGVSRFESGVSHVDHDLLFASNAEAKARAKDNLKTAVRWHGVHLQNFGVGALSPTSGQTTPNMAPFDAQADLARQMGGKLIVALYNIPWWLRGKTTFSGGVQTTVKYTQTQEFDTDGRLLTDSKPLFHTLMVAALRHILRVHGCRDFVTHNEYKGFQYRSRDTVGQAYDYDDYAGTPGHADLGFCEMYRLWAVALTAACQAENIPLSDVRLYGPYTILRSQGVNDADSVPMGHALRDRVWGSMNKQGTVAAEYFVAWAKRTGVKFDGLSIDFGTGNKDGVTVEPDDFEVAYEKMSDVLWWTHNLLNLHGYPPTFPILASELYVKPQAPTPAGSTAYRAAQKAVALAAWVEWGGWLPLWWGIDGPAEGPNGGTDPAPGEGGLVTATDKADGGQRMPFCDVLQLFHTHFSKGTPLHEVTEDGNGVLALASATHVLLVNTTAGPLTVRVDDVTVELGGYLVRVVER